MTAIFARADFHEGLAGLKDRHLLRNLAYVDGRWVAGDAGKGFDVTDPATGKSLAWLAAVDTDQVTSAIDAASRAFPKWQALLPQERAKILRKWYDLMLAHRKDLALIMTLEQGKPLAESLGEIEYDVVRERKKLAYGGAVSLVVTVDKGSHKLVGEPQITFSGVAGLGSADTLVRVSAEHEKNGDGSGSFAASGDADRSVRAPLGFAAAARSAISDAVAEMKRDQIADKAVFKENLRIHLKRFVQKELGTKPVIVTTIVEV